MDKIQYWITISVAVSTTAFGCLIASTAIIGLALLALVGTLIVMGYLELSRNKSNDATDARFKAIEGAIQGMKADAERANQARALQAAYSR